MLLAAAGLAAWDARAGAPTVGSHDPILDAAHLSQIYGAQFQQQTVTQGERPELPSGARGITAKQAIRTALTDSPAVGIAASYGSTFPGVNVEAEYGSLTLQHYGTRKPGGPFRRYIQNRPVWIVALAGDGVSIGASGPDSAAAAPHHEIDVVIDATTGKYLHAFSYR